MMTNPEKLQRFAQWRQGKTARTIRLAERYAHLNSEDLKSTVRWMRKEPDWAVVPAELLNREVLAIIEQIAPFLDESPL
jgi:hypothetical protein